MLPLVSIGIPTFNRGSQLENIVRIVLSQTYSNLQVIVVDNHSTDHASLESLDRLSKFNDDRLEIYRNKINLGVLQNAHEALSYARGKYFTWISDDDWRAPTFIERLVSALESNPNFGFAISEYRDIVDPLTPSLLHLKSRQNLFSNFSSNNELKRIIGFYCSDHAFGKCNLFYSLFLTKNLKTICLKRASQNWLNLSMDRNISFLYLKNNRLLFVPETLIALRVQNQKNYHNKVRFLSRIYDLISEILFTYENVENYFHKLLILVVTPFKIFQNYLFRICLKIRRIYNTSVYIPSRRRELNAIKKISMSSNHGSRKKLSLHQLTIVCVATRDVEKAAAALAYSMSDIKFANALLFSHYKPWNLHDDINHIHIKSFRSVEEWGFFIIYHLHKFIKTSHILLIHPDGFVVNPNSWSDEFLNYDYIGAPWPLPKDDFSYKSKSGIIVRVGNSVSIRSHAILKAPMNLKLDWESYYGYFHEDGFLCVQNYDLLCEKGFNFAPIATAYSFSVENELPDMKNKLHSFAFHDWMGKNKSYPRLSDF